MKAANDSAKKRRQPTNLANLKAKMTKPPCLEMNALASEKNPSTTGTSSKEELGSSSDLGGRKREQMILTGLDSNIKCSSRKRAEATATYTGIMRVLYHILRTEM